METVNMLKKSQSAPVSPVDGDAVLAVLDRRIRELNARDRDALEQIITIEKTTGSAQVDAGADMTQAEALLEGEKFVATRERPVSQLDALYAERKVIAHALKIGNSKRQRLATERAGRIWAAHFPEIAEIEKRRVFLAIELQKINRKRETLREKIDRAGGGAFLSTDGAELLGCDVGDEKVAWAANRLVADGIATTAEIEKAYDNG
jgi:hypothetical protein